MNVQPIKPYNKTNNPSFRAVPIGKAEEILTEALSQVYKEHLEPKKWLNPKSAQSIMSVESAMQAIADFGRGLRIKINAYTEITTDTKKFFISSINGKAPHSQIEDNVFSVVRAGSSALETITKVAHDIRNSELTKALITETPEHQAIKFMNKTFSENA